MFTPVVRLTLVLSSLVLPVSAVAADLVFGKPLQGRVGESAEYTLQASGAGLLTLALHGDADLNLNVMDEDGQLLPDGQIDSDQYGNAGLEAGMVTLPYAGRYLVRVSSLGGDSAPYTLHANFLPFTQIARTPDTDGRPGNARRMNVGQSFDDSINGDEGDLRDWFTVTAPDNGTFTIVTRARGEGGDIALEAFLGSNFDEPAARSDQDAQDNSANESISLTVSKGDVVHVRVYGVFSGAAEYRISAGFMQ